MTISNNYFYLRNFTEHDDTALYQALNDKRVTKHLASSGISLKDCQKIIADALTHWETYHIGSYAVLNTNHNIIGWAGFKRWKEAEFEILIVLSPKNWGLGNVIYKELCKQAKNQFMLKEIYILLPETRKSFRWIKHKGFIEIGKEIYNDEPFRKFVKKL